MLPFSERIGATDLLYEWGRLAAGPFSHLAGFLPCAKGFGLT
ncbi:hypothetical protein B4110_3346 [Parageobacillus toebii]|uniref:Uncharacterized protein n=1 Tax=Parageobacillus toebii TaxID=153151 RepID=A0A150N4J4_9BACL|nr:hypothetical protein B4110_3346 [Parageobacillus toebii]